MDLRQALKEQYHASLAMLAECVEKCPDILWTEGKHPRSFCRIAWHAAYFAHLYLVQDEAAFNESVSAWPQAVRAALGVDRGRKPTDAEAFEAPGSTAPLSPREMTDYIAYVRGQVDATVDSLDLDSPATGYNWYPHMTKLSHEIMNLRHIQGHVGQLSELLMERDIDTGWIGAAGSNP